jgi:hypothetical protein
MFALLPFHPIMLIDYPNKFLKNCANKNVLLNWCAFWCLSYKPRNIFASKSGDGLWVWLNITQNIW